MTIFKGLIPPVFAFLFASSLGSWWGAAAGWSALISHLLLATVVVLAGKQWTDPLDLGGRWNLLLLAFLVVCAGAVLMSPVPRAGRTALTLLPLFLLLPAVFANCWRGRNERRAGILAMAVGVGSVAAWGLIGWLVLDTPRASLPLGHHNLLAGWLLMATPIALVSWRYGTLGRSVAIIVGLLSTSCLMAAGSFAALGSLVVCALIYGVKAASRKQRVLLLAMAASLVVVGGPRLFAILGGSDFSAMARMSYLVAGWHGVLERPLLGWGLGAVPWTISEFFRPQPGIHPPGLLLSDLHSLPLQLLYQVGALGTAIIFGLVTRFVVIRRHVGWRDSDLANAAVVASLSVGVFCLAGLPLDVPAIPVIFAVVIGALLAAGRAASRGRSWQDRRSRWFLASIGVSCVLAVLPADLAQVSFDRAHRAHEEQSSVRMKQELTRALAWDPTFPLYAAVQASVAELPDSELERRAAEGAYGIGTFWLVAGLDLSNESALVRACDLDPMSPFAAFLLASIGSENLRSQRAARAIAIDPRLLGSLSWGRAHRQAYETLVEHPLLEADWRSSLAEAVPEIDLDSPELRRLVLSVDQRAETSQSLFLFRRRPWPRSVMSVELDAGVTGWRLPPPATSLRSTPSRMLRDGCRLAAPGDRPAEGS